MSHRDMMQHDPLQQGDPPAQQDQMHLHGGIFRSHGLAFVTQKQDAGICKHLRRLLGDHGITCNQDTGCAIRFLQDGDRVKVSIRFRGRQITKGEMGEDVMEAFFNMVSDVAVKERPPKQEGRNMFMVLAPKN